MFVIARFNELNELIFYMMTQDEDVKIDEISM